MNPGGDPIPRFEFATATRIVFGSGTLRELGAIAREFGSRALVVTGRGTERARPALESLADSGVESCTFPIPGEPTVDRIVDGIAFARSERVDLVLGFGGGSAIDAAKAIAGLVPNGDDPFEHLEVIGRGRPLVRPPLPWIAVPTTAGAGAEVTRNAVLTSPAHRFKASLRSPLLLARVALVDPVLTLDLPPDITAATGLDALTQLIEPFTCNRTNPLVDTLCRDGIRRVARSLAVAVRDGHQLPARADLAQAALFGGLALANAGLGAVHGLAAPIGGAHPTAPHGAVCAALLPHVLRLNLQALRARQPGSEAIARYAEVAALVTGRPSALAEEGIEAVAELVRSTGIPSLRVYGLEAAGYADLAEKASMASSMKANPIALSREELVRILEAAGA